jgi:RNA polymerase sigma-70 factor (ECF subfamily)
VDDATIRRRLPDEVPGLLRFARFLTRDPGRAEDLVSETVVRALERAADFREDSSLATWLHRILHNLAVDQHRRSREVPVDDVAEQVEARWQDDAYTVDAAEVVARAETRAELEDALIRLPVIYRAAVVLHDAEGLTVAEIAELTDVTLSAAKQRLRRGRMMLVSALAAGAERRAELDGVPLACWDARFHVGDYLDGALDSSTSRLLEKHLGTCPTCPPLYASLVGVAQALGRTRQSGPGAHRDPDTVVPEAIARQIAGRNAAGDM